jgi:hypothetical protein
MSRVSLNVGFVTSPKLCGASSHSINAFAVVYNCGGHGNIEEKVEKMVVLNVHIAQESVILKLHATHFKAFA